MRLHFNWKLSLFVVICLPVLINAGFWQVGRGDEKKAMQTQLSELKQKPNIPYLELNTDQRQNYRNVSAVGRFRNEIVLVDNQIYQGQFGYEVIQPFVLSNDEVVLVARGWVKGDLDRRLLPMVETPKDKLELEAYLYKPSENIQLDNIVQENGWPKRMQTADVEKLYNALGKNDKMKGEFLLRLKSYSNAALDSHWQLIKTGPEKHWGYAVQWFAMAFLLVALFIWSSISKKQSTSNME